MNEIDTFLTTRFEGLGYAKLAEGLWMFLDTSEQYPAPIGPQYLSEAELLENLDTFAYARGWTDEGIYLASGTFTAIDLSTMPINRDLLRRQAIAVNSAMCGVPLSETDKELLEGVYEFLHRILDEADTVE